MTPQQGQVDNDHDYTTVLPNTVTLFEGPRFGHKNLSETTQAW